MNRQDVLDRVQEIVRDVLESDNIVLQEETTTNDVDGWDSLNHIQIIAEIQDYYKIKFSAREMISWENVGDLCDNIILKLK